MSAENNQITRDPFVQIVIPVYNAQDTLRRCLDSVAGQTFTDWEALLIDDCSTDGSRDIMKEYANRDSRFVCVYHKENKGVSATRNQALEMVTANYTTFLDSDDWLEKETLQILTDAAGKYRAEIVQCRFMYDYSNGKTLCPAGAFGKETYLEHKDFKPIHIKMMTGINMNHVCMKLIRTELIKNMKFDTAMRTAEDLEFSIRLFQKAANYLFVPQVLYHYYRGGASLTGSGLSKKEKLAANRHIADVMADSLEEWGMNYFPYRLMARMRTYLIIISKIFRTIREKIVTVR